MTDGQKHRGNTDGLRPPWKPGESGNPGGRPKGTSITARLREIVEKDDGEAAKAIAEAAMKAAKGGDFRFFKELCDRLDGPIKQQIEASIITQVKAIDKDAFDGA